MSTAQDKCEGEKSQRRHSRSLEKVSQKKGYTEEVNAAKDQKSDWQQAPKRVTVKQRVQNTANE